MTPPGPQRGLAVVTLLVLASVAAACVLWAVRDVRPLPVAQAVRPGVAATVADPSVVAAARADADAAVAAFTAARSHPVRATGRYWLRLPLTDGTTGRVRTQEPLPYQVEAEAVGAVRARWTRLVDAGAWPEHLTGGLPARGTVDAYHEALLRVWVRTERLALAMTQAAAVEQRGRLSAAEYRRVAARLWPGYRRAVGAYTAASAELAAELVGSR